MTTSSRRSRRRGKTLIALFAATAALTGGAQALAPAPAAAMIDQDMSESECNANFGSWDWFNEVCDLNFGGGGGGSTGGGSGGSTGGPLYDGRGSGGGGDSADDSSADAIRQREELAAAEIQAARELMELELKAAKAELEGLRSYKRRKCAALEILEYEAKNDDDGLFSRGWHGRARAEKVRKLKREREELGCSRWR